MWFKRGSTTKDELKRGQRVPRARLPRPSAGRTCSNQMILKAVWGSGYGDKASYVHRFRQKLNDESAALIHTTPGVGYILQMDPA